MNYIIYIYIKLNLINKYYKYYKYNFKLIFNSWIPIKGGILYYRLRNVIVIPATYITTPYYSQYFTEYVYVGCIKIYI